MQLAGSPHVKEVPNNKQQNTKQLTVRSDLQHLPTSRFGLQVQLRPEYGRGLSRVGRLSADLDLVLGDVVVQAGQEVLGQVVATVDAPVVADELAASHLLGDLHR